MEGVQVLAVHQGQKEKYQDNQKTVHPKAGTTSLKNVHGWQNSDARELK
jgi:hypothetical protein